MNVAGDTTRIRIIFRRISGSSLLTIILIFQNSYKRRIIFSSIFRFIFQVRKYLDSSTISRKKIRNFLYLESGTPSGEYLLIYTARLPIHFGLEALTGPGVSIPSLQFLKKGRFFIDRLDRRQRTRLESRRYLLRQEGVLTRASSEFLVQLTTTRRRALLSVETAPCLQARFILLVLVITLLSIGTRVFRLMSFSAQR